MKRTIAAVVLLISLCAQAPARTSGGAKDPETVVGTYHVRPGSEAQMEKLMREDHWTLRKRLHLVFDAPHVLVSGTESGGKPYLREILTWRDHDTPDNAPPGVEAFWKRMDDSVEKRDGKPSIEIEDVALLVPAGR